MLDKLNAALQFQQEALNLRAQRQEILSANIANADTPGFQARDIDFASQLQKVMEAGRANGSGMSLELTNARHIPAATSSGPAACSARSPPAPGAGYCSSARSANARRWR